MTLGNLQLCIAVTSVFAVIFCIRSYMQYQLRKLQLCKLSAGLKIPAAAMIAARLIFSSLLIACSSPVSKEIYSHISMLLCIR